MEKIPKPELIRKVKVDETWDKSLCFFFLPQNRGWKLFRFRPEMRQSRQQETSLCIINFLQCRGVVETSWTTKDPPGAAFKLQKKTKACVFWRSTWQSLFKTFPDILVMSNAAHEGCPWTGTSQLNSSSPTTKTQTHIHARGGGRWKQTTWWSCRNHNNILYFHTFLLTGPTGIKQGRRLVRFDCCTIMAKPNPTGRV